MQKIREAISFYGRVQGVGFRYKLGYLAQMYSVTGWARNEYDGSVSTELQGLEEDIDKIIQALYNDRYIEIDDIRRRRISLDENERRFRKRSSHQVIRGKFPEKQSTRTSVTRSTARKMVLMCYFPSLRMM